MYHVAHQHSNIKTIPTLVQRENRRVTGKVVATTTTTPCDAYMFIVILLYISCGLAVNKYTVF